MAKGMAAKKKARSSNDWMRLGIKSDKQGDEKKAMQCFSEAFDADPTNITALKSLSLKLVMRTERSAAISVLEKAVKANPNDPDIYWILGNLALDMQMDEQALAFFQLVASLRPDDLTAQSSIATALRELERFDEAITLLQALLPSHPDNATLWYTLATVVSERDGLEAALPFYEETLRIDPDMVNALSDLAEAYSFHNDFEKCVEMCSRAIAIDNEDSQPHYIASIAYLSLGKLKEGWKEYEWRQHWRRPTSLRFVTQAQRWNGEDLAGKSLVIFPEQGIGDELLFASCLSDITDLPSNCYIGCDPRLVSLYKRSFPRAQIMPPQDFTQDGQRYRELPQLSKQGITPDYYIEIGSLPKFLHSSVKDLPVNEHGYLTPSAERVTAWKEKLDHLGTGPKVGIAWHSSKRSHKRNRHYTELNEWGPIFATPGVTFIDLQYDGCREELAEAEKTFGVTIHHFDDIDLRNDLDEQTALIKALDIVVCPAITPAAMALATATELWLLVRQRPWWSFGQQDHSPLGPSRFFFHSEDAGWQKPIDEIAKALAEHD